MLPPKGEGVKLSQRNKIAAELRHGWVTPMDALKKCGSMRLGARVFELRRLGVSIREKWVQINNRTKVKAFRIG